jgi:hypothetical protein
MSTLRTSYTINIVFNIVGGQSYGSGLTTKKNPKTFCILGQKDN